MPRGAAGTAVPKKGRPGPKAHKLPEEFPSGLVLKDFSKQEWQLGSVIGQGGFGLIYLASQNASKPVDKKTATHVIKIEPKNNGPLYCEMHFYQRGAKLANIQSFISKHRLAYLGIPPFAGAGIHQHKSQEYRFLVMPRLGTDLQKLFAENGKRFPPHVVFAIGLRMIDALQYLHENEFVHADIKAANILLGYTKGNIATNEIYLVDFGLAYRFLVDGVHKEYKEDPRKAHDGTIEFTSRDAHKGVYPSRRGDLEILGYCMIQWLCGRLPWENNLSNPEYVANSKERFMSDVKVQVKDCLKGCPPFNADCMIKYMEKVKRLDYDSTPNYKEMKEILRSGLSNAGIKDEWKVDFAEKAKGVKRKSTEMSDSPAAKKTKSPAKTPKSPGAAASPRKPASFSKPAKGSGVNRKKPAAPAKPRGKAAKSSVPVQSPHLSQSPALTSGASASPAIDGRSPGKVVKSSAKASTLSRSPVVRNGGVTRAKHKASPKARPGKITPLTPTGVQPRTSTTKRRVKRVKAVQSDACIQTSPGLLGRR